MWIFASEIDKIPVNKAEKNHAGGALTSFVALNESRSMLDFLYEATLIPRPLTASKAFPSDRRPAISTPSSIDILLDLAILITKMLSTKMYEENNFFDSWLKKGLR